MDNESKKRFSVLAIFKFLKNFLFSCLGLLFIIGLLFGMAIIVGILIYVLTGNEVVIQFMSDLLARVLQITNYF